MSYLWYLAQSISIWFTYSSEISQNTMDFVHESKPYFFFSFNYFMNRRISANLKQYSVFPQRNWAILRDLGGLLSLTWQQEMLIITFLWEEKERSQTQHTSMQPWKKLATAHEENAWDKLPLFYLDHSWLYRSLGFKALCWETETYTEHSQTLLGSKQAS